MTLATGKPAAKHAGERDARHLPSVTIIGLGNWGSHLALALREAGVALPEIIVRAKSPARSRLAAAIGARLTTLTRAQLSSEVFWICAPDAAISHIADDLVRSLKTRDRRVAPIVFHSSGALPSAELAALRAVNASLASVHPLMTFPKMSSPQNMHARFPLAGVPFAVEGDAPACRAARKLIQAMGGEPFTLSPEGKARYHAFGAFTSPLLIALLAAASETASAVGWTERQARRRMKPIVERTVANFFAEGPRKSFSGPLVRGDAATIARHLEALRAHPRLVRVYQELARFALSSLPTKNVQQIRRLLEKS